MKIETLENEAIKIITKLENRVNKKGYCENLGQKEQRQFNEKVDNTDLTYVEKTYLKEMFNKKIETL